MDPVARQYEVYPYPERDPADEARRLVVGSPSDPAEVDHFLFRGRRDWSRPFRALVAGGGAGDALVMLAQKLADAGCPADLTYLDLSSAARGVAEARLAARGLSARCLTGDLLGAPALAAEGGPFDYIDCCGVLHHMADPQAGFDALGAALAPDGGLGFMVYAPYGRDGVYPLQAAFSTLLGEDAPQEKVRLARAALAALPESNGFKRNPFLSDHLTSDAGLHDLLLNARDRAFAVTDLLTALRTAGLDLVSFVEPARYDPARCLPRTPDFAARLARLGPDERLALGERLAGDIRMHVGYAAKADRAGRAIARLEPEAVPRLNGLDPRALARKIAQDGAFRVAYPGRTLDIEAPRDCAPLIALIGGGRSFADIARAARLDWLVFAHRFGPAFRALTAVNLLRCSQGIAG